MDGMASLRPPSINHHRHEGTWISDVERIWKMVMIVRSIPDKLPYWTRVVFYSSAYIGCFARDLDEGLSVSEWLSTHLTLLAAVHVCQGHMLVCVAACTLSTLSLSTCDQLRPVAGLVSQQAITAPKLGQFTIFSAMKRHCCCQHCFLREGMRRQWEWNRAMLYKEDYKDKTTLTSLKFEDTSGETRRLSKSSCLLEGWQLAVFFFFCTLVGTMNRTEIQILSFTSGVKSWHLTEKDFSKWQPSTCRTKPPCFSAEDVFNQQ